MPSKSPAQRLLDILNNIDAVTEFTSGLTLEEFARDRKTVYAVTRALEIISEASRRLPEELRQRHPEIDWVGIAAVWETVQHDLLLLRQAAAEEFERSSKQMD